MRAVVSIIRLRAINKLASKPFKLKVFHEKVTTNII